MPHEIHGEAYNAVRLIYDHSPGRSWRRLNSALQDALTAAITAHLSFLPNDFSAIAKDMRGGYWMGDGAGSAHGERYYNFAVNAGHTAACIAFEKYAGRPAALWSEDVKTPERLRIGSEFTWQGLKVTVTSMKTDHLVACTYGGSHFRGGGDELSIGQFERLNDQKYRTTEEITALDGGGMTIRFSAPMEDPYGRSKPNRVVKITYDELAAARKKYEVARRVAMKDIAAAETLVELKAISEMLAKFGAEGHYRHFDIEDIRKALFEREKVFGSLMKEAEALEAWRGGTLLHRFFKTVALRVRAGRVETSTGQSAAMESVRKVLPVVLRRRNSVGPVHNLAVDSYKVVEQSADGVKVGCTLIPWAEVERLPSLLEASNVA